MDKTDKNDIALIHTEGLDEGIRCAMCTNSIKSDRGCDGGCVVNNAMYKEVMDVIENHIVDTDKMVEPTTKNDLSSGLENVSPIIDWNKCHTSEQLNSIATTKNDLGVDAISRQALYDALYERFHEEDTNNITNVTLGSVRNFVKNFPSVTPQEPKTGHWKYFQNEKGDWMNVCSNCNSDCGVGYPYNYCPNCGADMRGNTKRKGNPVEGNNESYNCENWIP